MEIAKVYGVLITLILLGFVLIVVAHTVPAQPPVTAGAAPQIVKWYETWPTWLDTLGTTLFIAGSLGVIDKALLSSSFIKQIQKVFNLHESTTAHGLERVSLNAGNFDYARLIEDSSELRIVMNDARTWVSSRIDQFQRRFSKRVKTEVFIVDPDGQFSKVLADKTGYEMPAQKAKALEAVNRFKEEFERMGSRGELRIYFLKYFPTHSVVIGDDSAVVTLYGISKGRRAVPTFLFERTNRADDIFCTLLKDVQNLQKESALHFSSKVPATAGDKEHNTSDASNRAGGSGPIGDTHG
jgi:hypothetical protein